MTKTRLLLAPLVLVLPFGCLSVIDLEVTKTLSGAGTGGRGTGSTTGAATGGAATSSGTGTGGAATSSSGTGGTTLCVPGATTSCYGGPAQTEGVGICKAGTQTCAADGASWGPCVGEVMPQAENCATPADEDCDGQTPACPTVPLQWAKRFGKFAWAQNVAADAAGNVVVVGWSVTGSVDFGGGVLPPSTGFSLVVAKLDASGNYLWSRGFNLIGNGTVANQHLGATVDGAGNVLITGWADVSNSIDFGGGPLTGMVVAKLDASGQHVWSKQYAGGAGQSVAADGAGNVFLAGAITGSIDFGGGPLTNTSTSGNSDVFVVKLDANGSHVWSRDCGQGNPVGKIVAVDTAGNVIVTGGLSGLVAKLDAGGTPLWSKSWGSPDGSVSVTGVAVDKVGDVVVTGELHGTVDLGGGVLTAPDMEGDTFAAKLDGMGNHAWSRLLGAVGWVDGPGPNVTVDAARNVWLTGSMGGTVDFGGGPLTSAGKADAFVAELTEAGGYLGARIFGDTQTQTGYDIATDSGGNAIVVGEFYGSIDFGSGPLSAGTHSNIFVARFAP